MEAKHIGLVWASESMIPHKVEKVCLEIEASELVGVASRPRAWHAFRAYGCELQKVLKDIYESDLQSVPRSSNKIAFMIARSVMMDLR